jgi:hypothetical protein
MNERNAKLQSIKNKRAKEEEAQKLQESTHKELIEVVVSLKSEIVSLNEKIENDTLSRRRDNSTLEDKVSELGEAVKSIQINYEQTDITPLIAEIKKIKNIVNVEPTVIGQDNIFDIYKPADEDTDNPTKYYGYLAKDGRWFVMRVANGKYRYATSKKKYDFSNKEQLDYKYITEVQL